MEPHLQQRPGPCLMPYVSLLGVDGHRWNATTKLNMARSLSFIQLDLFAFLLLFELVCQQTLHLNSDLSPLTVVVQPEAAQWYSLKLLSGTA